MATHIDYEKFLKGKTVALVGGHDDIDWDSVNRCEVVVRVNDHWARQGGRIDAIYDSCACDLNHGFYLKDEVLRELKFAQLNITHTFFSNQASEFRQISKTLCDANIPFDIYVHAPADLFQKMDQLKKVPERHQWYTNWIKEWAIYPFTGVLAMHHLLLQPIESLYVDGMDLFHEYDAENKDPKNNWHGMHFMPTQLTYLRNQLAHHPKLWVSDIFRKAIKNDSR